MSLHLCLYDVRSTLANALSSLGLGKPLPLLAVGAPFGKSGGEDCQERFLPLPVYAPTATLAAVPAKEDADTQREQADAAASAQDAEPPKKRTAAFGQKKGAFRKLGRGLLDPRDRQLEAIDKLGDPLLFLRTRIDWEIFRPELATIYGENRREIGGRKPIDPLLMFKIVMLQRLYNLSDDQAELQIRDRASFQRFLGLEVEDGSPDAKTIWLFKERIKELGLERDLFFRFDAFLADQGFAAKGGQIIDATFVEVPRQRNTRKENEDIKAGCMPEGWKDQPHKLAQKDLDAEWTKKNGQAYYGYKDHANVDEASKLIRDYSTTGASVHDSCITFDILDTETKVAKATKGASQENIELVRRVLYADSAYRSKECEEKLRELGIPSCIHERAYKNTPLTDEQKANNREKSKVRVRVEHVFGCQQTSMNRASFIRTIGSARACMMVGLINLGYNMLRFLQLLKAVPATV